MIPTEKFPEIIEGLLRKTKEGKATWTPTDDESVYQLVLTHSTIRIEFNPARMVLDKINIKVYDKIKDQLVDQYEVFDGDNDWPIAISLYSAITGKTFRTNDDIIDEIEKFIADDAPVKVQQHS